MGELLETQMRAAWRGCLKVEINPWKDVEERKDFHVGGIEKALAPTARQFFCMAFLRRDFEKAAHMRKDPSV